MPIHSLVGPGVDPVGAAAVDRMLADGDLASVHYVATTGSTNDDAKRFVRDHSDLDGAGASGTIPRLFLADQQTAGRGRHGRVWTSDPSSLTFSLLIQQRWDPRLSLAVGVAVAESIESVHPEVSIGLKWPNDLWIGQAKLAGILIEAVRPGVSAGAATGPTRSVPANPAFTTGSMPPTADDVTGPVPFQVIGVGVNLGAHPPDGVDTHEASAATPQPDTHSSVSQAYSFQSRFKPTASPNPPVSLGSAEHRFVWLPRFVQSIQDWMRALAENPGDVIDGFASRCVLRGHRIESVGHGTRVQGTCLGVDPVGRLRVARDAPETTADREITLESGEVRRVIRQDSKSS